MISNSILNVLWASKTKYPQNWGIKSHRHTCCQIFYVAEGKCRFFVDGTAFEVGENGYIIVFPNEEHGMIKNQDNLVRMIDIKLDIQNELAKEVSKIQRSGQATEAIGYLFKLIASELSHSGVYNKEIIESYLYVVLLKLVPGANKEGPMIPTGIPEEEWPQCCRDVAQYIKNQYSRSLSLEDVADHLGYNKNYICGMFRRATGMTVMDYLKLVRIERACDCIQKSDYTFQQISYMVGFSSVYHFYKVFKQYINCTPGEFKKSAVENSAVKQDVFNNEDNYDVL